MLFKHNAGGSGTLVAATVQLFLEYNIMGVYSQMSQAAFFQFVSGLLWAKWQFNNRFYINVIHGVDEKTGTIQSNSSYDFYHMLLNEQAFRKMFKTCEIKY